MKKVLLAVLLSIPTFVFSQQDSISSGMYSWKKPTQRIQDNLFSTVLFQGRAHDMSFLQMTANTILRAKEKSRLQVPDTEEHLMLIKTGTLTISIKDSSWSIGAGSIALLMPGEKYAIQNSVSDSCNYYEMKYSS